MKTIFFDNKRSNRMLKCMNIYIREFEKWINKTKMKKQDKNERLK